MLGLGANDAIELYRRHCARESAAQTKLSLRYRGLFEYLCKVERSFILTLVDIRARPIPGVIKYPPDFALHQPVTPILASQMARRSRGPS